MSLGTATKVAAMCLCCVTVLLGACGWRPATANQRVPDQGVALGATQACGGLPRFSRSVAEEIMAGRLTIPPFPPVTIDPRRNGSVNWRLDPFHHPTWVSYFRSGGWIEMLVSGYLAGGRRANAYRARAEVITKSWLRGPPIADRDARALVCISVAFPGQQWINGQIPVLVNYMAEHWEGAWNHGLKQDLELLSIGCGYPESAFGGQARDWRQTAADQMIASFRPNPLGPEIDARGATNEQATLYADFVGTLWQQALPRLASCGYRLPGWILERITLLSRFITQATEPDGYLVQIGDTYLERPLVSGPRRGLVSVYDAGYVFGRSGWGPGASFYSLRFGPGRRIHGHSDHMSLTYFARGRDLIVNAGHVGYENTPYRAYLRSPQASSTFVLAGEPFAADVPTSLLRQAISPYDQFYEFSDAAFGGVTRYRSVFADQRPDLMLVLDRASGGARPQQFWHLDPALRVIHYDNSGAIAAARGTELVLRQIPLPGQTLPPGSTRIVSGWVSRHMLQRTPAQIVTMTRSGPILTLIVPAAPGTSVTTEIAGHRGGPYRLTVHIGHTSLSFTITLAGVIG